MLNQKEREFIKAVKRNQKPLIVCGLIALFIAIFWVYLVDVSFHKAGFISTTAQFRGKVVQIEPHTALETKLKGIILSNLDFEITLYQLCKTTIILLVSCSLLIVCIGCFIFVIANRKFLNVFKNIEDKN